MTIQAVDMFCGAGGTSTGLYAAADTLGLSVNLLAINHWKIAIATHSANHRHARHLCETLDGVSPRTAVPSGHLHLLVASPECIHFSNARGGKPMSDQSRASAWHVLRWCEALRVDNVIIENVREFMNWGPLGANGRPIISRKGETFQAFITAMRALNYTVEYRVLNAADFGDHTTRERLFIIARRGRKAIYWPEPTHSREGDLDLFGKRKRWRAAREIIDWTLPGKSIFERERPLAPNTMRRIIAGLEKFGGKELEPFLVVLRRHGEGRSINEPVPTLTAGGNHVGLCEPFVLGQQSGAAPRSVDNPVPTVAGAGAISLVQPFVLPLNRSKDKPRSTKEPLKTVTATSSDMGLVQPFIIGAGGPSGSGEPQSVDTPMSTVLTQNHKAVVQPFLVEYYGSKGGKERVRSVNEPMPTITAVGKHAALCEPLLVQYYGNGQATPVKEPVPTVTTKDRFGLAEPFLVQFNNNSKASSVNEPVPTVMGRDKFAICAPEVNGMRLDIRFRMLQPHELAAAQGFPKDYKFTGSREQQVKQIGNAVPTHLAQALCRAVLSDFVRRAK